MEKESNNSSSLLALWWFQIPSTPQKNYVGKSNKKVVLVSETFCKTLEIVDKVAGPMVWMFNWWMKGS